MPVKRCLKTFLIVCFALLFSMSAYAQKDNENDEIDYPPATIQNISDLLIRKGIINIEDPIAADEYLRIHHCEIYNKYAANDFAWSRIREAISRDVLAHIADFPQGLEVSAGIELTKYNMSTAAFSIAPTDQMLNTGSMTVFEQPAGRIDTCSGTTNNAFVPRIHPLSVSLKLSRPMRFEEVPMTEAVGNKLIALMNNRKVRIPRERRMVTMVVNVRITGTDPLASNVDPLRRTLLGSIDQIRVYEGPERKILLYKLDIKSMRDHKG